jgi:hypothetical protein
MEEEGNVSEKSIRGKKSRAAGQRFETKVRINLENLGWVVSKWMNTVDYEREGKIGKLVPAKRKYNPFMKAMTIGTGFPDFVCFRKVDEENYEVIGLEVKSNGGLDRQERDMCFWLVTNKIFSKILIAKKGSKRGEIEYVDFEKKYGKKE